MWYFNLLIETHKVVVSAQISKATKSESEIVKSVLLCIFRITIHVQLVFGAVNDVKILPTTHLQSWHRTPRKRITFLQLSHWLRHRMVREKLHETRRQENRNDAKFNLTPNTAAGARCIHDNENLFAAFNETFALRSATSY